MAIASEINFYGICNIFENLEWVLSMEVVSLAWLAIDIWYFGRFLCFYLEWPNFHTINFVLMGVWVIIVWGSHCALSINKIKNFSYTQRWSINVAHNAVNKQFFYVAHVFVHRNMNSYNAYTIFITTMT